MRLGMCMGMGCLRKAPTPTVATTGQIGSTFIIGISALG